MDAIQQQYARMQKTIDGMREVAESLQRIAAETAEFTGQFVERRSDPRRPDRLLPYSEKKAMRTAQMKDQDTIVDFGFGDEFTQDMNEPRQVCPGTEVSRGRYEGRLLRTLDGLRESLRYYNERRLYGNPAIRDESYAKLRTTLNLVRKVQTLLNRTGSWSFLLADPS